MKVFHSYFWRDFWYNQISSRIWPRQRWLTKSIPRTWSDKTYLIPHVLYTMIIDFVEGEECFQRIDWTYTEEQKVSAEKLKQIYSWAKTERKKKEYEMWAAYPNPTPSLDDINNQKYKYEELYGEVNRLEKFIDDKDTEYLTWIVQNREYLWT